MASPARPSEQIAACLHGKIPYDALPDSLKSAIQLDIYKLACKVLDGSERDRERLANEIPKAIITQVKKEVQKIHKYRLRTSA